MKKKQKTDVTNNRCYQSLDIWRIHRFIYSSSDAWLDFRTYCVRHWQHHLLMQKEF